MWTNWSAHQQTERMRDTSARPKMAGRPFSTHDNRQNQTESELHRTLRYTYDISRRRFAILRRGSTMAQHLKMKVKNQTHAQMNLWFVSSGRIWIVFATDGLTCRRQERTDVANNIDNSSVWLKDNNSSWQFARMHNSYSLHCQDKVMF